MFDSDPRRTSEQGANELPKNPGRNIDVVDRSAAEIEVRPPVCCPTGRNFTHRRSLVDATGTVLMPGLIDSHVHAWEGQPRGLAPDADLSNYVAITHDGIAKAYRLADISIAERLVAAQSLNAGITTIVDNSHNSRSRKHSETAIEALLDTGIRAVYAAGGALSGDHEDHLPHDLIRLRDEYFSSHGLVDLRMFDIRFRGAGVSGAVVPADLVRGVAQETLEFSLPDRG